ncbi:MAG: hydantoinase B/oxoprolinase family protein [Alphaproteobacteria bacterium]|jgi:N-methylhydantoinase B|nr:hydantoinase B/oxoprolinase family protein [Alphaproteobacteria bacterium]
MMGNEAPDPITLAVTRGALHQVADEMDLHLIHAAISPIISEMHDCAHGIYDARTGETIAQGGFGLPMFLANMQYTVQNLLEYVKAEGGFQPGDIWIVNDPYLSGSHLQDVTLVAPYFVDGEPFALLANTGHWMDIGGSVPGGWAPQAREIHQEGIIIPPLRLFKGGVRNEELVKMILANLRLPDQIAGDLAAMTQVFHVGQRGLGDLIQRYGAATVGACIDEMMQRSEQQMREHIERVPNGTYRFTDHFDNDGIVDAPLVVEFALTVDGSDMYLDFTGTAPAATGSLNMAETTTRSLCFVALKHLFPDVPVNGGTFRPIHFEVPDGCMLAARYPSPVCGYTDVINRVIDVVFGALAQAVPEITPAAPFGTTGVTTVSGRREDGSYYVAVFPYPGGYGGSAASDGLVNGTLPSSLAGFMSVEMTEHRFPLRFQNLGVREDSGGAGRHRGGCGTVYAITALSDCLVSVLGDRVDHAPFGVEAGGPGHPNRVRFLTEGREWIPPMRSKAEKVSLVAGDSVHLASPGGGGFGDPLTRDLDAVERDLNLGFVTRASAEAAYGVVVESEDRLAGHPRYRLSRVASEERRSRSCGGSTGSGRDLLGD